MKRITAGLEITLIYVVSVGIFFFEFLPYDTRLIFLETFAALVLLMTLIRKIRLRDIGFRMDTFVPAAKLLFPGTAICVAILVACFILGIGTEYVFGRWWANTFFLYYLAVGAFSQEFGYRGYLLQRLRVISGNIWFLIIANSVLFSLLHALHRDTLVFIGTFIFGAYLTWAFVKRPNMLASTLAHGIVGTVAIILGFF
ncbi:MAG: CPBP family intramembrane glutamic endopeptidase [Parcubacteria group bacterium]